jgi:hypothetical protein
VKILLAAISCVVCPALVLLAGCEQQQIVPADSEIQGDYFVRQLNDPKWSGGTYVDGDSVPMLTDGTLIFKKGDAEIARFPEGTWDYYSK